MSGKLFVITGASGCGKTTLLNSLLSKKLNLIKAPKYASREVREEKNGIVDDIIHDSNITIDNYDLVYKLNEKTYGIKIDEIKQSLDKNRNLIIILSDFRVITRLKNVLKENVVTWYISSAINAQGIEKIQVDRYKNEFNLTPTESSKLYDQYTKLKSASELKSWRRLFECMGELLEDWKKYIPEKDSTEVRKNKIRDFHKSYIDKIHLFDHVILNHNMNNPEEMTRQAINIINFYENNISKPIKENPVIYIVSAASGSGKGVLMESIREVIGEQQIHITTKEAKREPKENDRRDGMKAIGVNGKFSKDFDIKWFFHKDKNHKGTEYAVSEKEIRFYLQNEKSQIFISNIGQIENFKKLFDKNVVFLYLHATRSDEDNKKFQYEKWKDDPLEAERRIKEVEKVHQDYIKHISQFDHVLLNTAFKEDLYEQMFTLIDYYKNKTK